MKDCRDCKAWKLAFYVLLGILIGLAVIADMAVDRAVEDANEHREELWLCENPQPAQDTWWEDIDFPGMTT